LAFHKQCKLISYFNLEQLRNSPRGRELQGSMPSLKNVTLKLLNDNCFDERSQFITDLDNFSNNLSSVENLEILGYFKNGDEHPLAYKYNGQEYLLHQRLTLSQAGLLQLHKLFPSIRTLKLKNVQSSTLDSSLPQILNSWTDLESLQFSVYLSEFAKPKKGSRFAHETPKHPIFDSVFTGLSTDVCKRLSNGNRKKIMSTAEIEKLRSDQGSFFTVPGKLDHKS